MWCSRRASHRPTSPSSPVVMTESIGSAGLYFSCYSIAAISLRILAGKLPERLGPKRVLLPAMFAVAVGLSVLVLARSPAHVALAGISPAWATAYTLPRSLGIIVTRARPSERGAALAIFTALFDAGALLGNPLFGNLVKLTGSYRLMFAASAFLMWIGTGVFSLADRRHD
ncbi:MAG: MFS transporter [Polyangiaceae bacterium]